jgi:hypothetical protein
MGFGISSSGFELLLSLMFGIWIFEFGISLLTFPIYILQFPITPAIISNN